MSVKHWSGFYTPFDENEVKRVVPTAGGSYAIWMNYADGHWSCYYIGKAHNLKKHLLECLSGEDPNRYIKESREYHCGFQWMEIATETERLGATKYLYDTLRPECNEADLRGVPLAVPLPDSPPNSNV